MVAYQLAFDLYDGATQHFLRKVHEVIRASLPAPPKVPPTTQEGEVLSTPVQETGGHNSLFVCTFLILGDFNFQHGGSTL